MREGTDLLRQAFPWGATVLYPDTWFLSTDYAAIEGSETERDVEIFFDRGQSQTVLPRTADNFSLLFGSERSSLTVAWSANPKHARRPWPWHSVHELCRSASRKR